MLRIAAAALVRDSFSQGHLLLGTQNGKGDNLRVQCTTITISSILHTIEVTLTLEEEEDVGARLPNFPFRFVVRVRLSCGYPQDAASSVER